MRFAIILSSVLLTAAVVRANDLNPDQTLFDNVATRDVWRIDWQALAEAESVQTPEPLEALVVFEAQPISLDQQTPATPQDTQPLHAAAVEHSDAYQLRAKLHKYASYATLPLFGAEVALGAALYNTPSNTSTLRTFHGIVGAGIIGLFGVNTVTGAWNLFGEGWSEKDGRTLRLIHGLIMMAADGLFVATWASGPNSHNLRQAADFETNKVTHRNLAIVSVSVGSVGYLIMLFGNH